MEFVFRLKKESDEESKKRVLKDIAKTNEGYRKVSLHIFKRTNSFVLKKLQAFPPIHQLALQAEYFKDNNIITGCIFFRDRVNIDVSDAFIEVIKTGEALGIPKFNQMLNYARRILGIDLKASRYTMSGFRKTLVKGFKDNGVEIDEMV